jgi:hypothetical protein
MPYGEPIYTIGETQPVAYFTSRDMLTEVFYDTFAVYDDETQTWIPHLRKRDEHGFMHHQQIPETWVLTDPRDLNVA